jgi:hypothetical protein
MFRKIAYATLATLAITSMATNLWASHHKKHKEAKGTCTVSNPDGTNGQSQTTKADCTGTWEPAAKKAKKK